MGLIHNPALRTVVLGGGASYNPATDADLKLWLRGDVAYTSIGPDVQATDSQTVLRWPDLSGNGRHARQDTGGFRGQWVASGIGGKPSINLDGSDDFYALEAGLDLLRNVAGATLFVVGQGASATVSSNQFALSIQRSGATTQRAGLNRVASNTYQAGGRRADTDAFASQTAGTTSTNPYIQCGAFDYAGAKLHHYLNGALLGTTDPFQTAGNTSDTDSIGIGIGSNTLGTACYAGRIAEILVYPQFITASKRAAITAYLGSRYGISVS